MQTPDEVRAAFEAYVRRVAFVEPHPALFQQDDEGYYLTTDVQIAWSYWAPAYASGSAARRERDAGVLREERQKYAAYCTTSNAGIPQAFDSAIARIEKE